MVFEKRFKKSKKKLEKIEVRKMFSLGVVINIEGNKQLWYAELTGSAVVPKQEL